MNSFSEMLVRAEFIHPVSDVSGSRIYLPAGWKLRSQIVSKASQLLDSIGFHEFHMPSIIRQHQVEKLDDLTLLSPKYYSITANLRLAATHEAVFFPFALDYIAQHENRLPLNLYHLGPAYRSTRSAPAPFNLGERFSYLEVFSVCRPEDYETTSAALFEWVTALPVKILGLPSIQVRRPRYGNFAVSEQTLTVESILPTGRTYCTAMLYKQGHLFTRIFASGDERFANLKSLHAALTDNLFYAYLANCLDSEGFWLKSDFAVTQALISCPEGNENCGRLLARLSDGLRKIGLRVDVAFRSSRKPSRELALFRRQGVPLFVALDSALAEAGRGWVYSRRQPFEAIELELANIAAMNALIIANDESIAGKWGVAQKDSIVDVKSVNDCRDVVDSGKIARFYLQDDPKAVAELDAQLPGAEILGYAIDSGDRGESIIDATFQAPVCYASRRL